MGIWFDRSVPFGAFGASLHGLAFFYFEQAGMGDIPGGSFESFLGWVNFSFLQYVSSAVTSHDLKHGQIPFGIKSRSSSW